MAVYLIECQICGEQYIGSTNTSLGLGQITTKVHSETL